MGSTPQILKEDSKGYAKLAMRNFGNLVVGHPLQICFHFIHCGYFPTDCGLIQKVYEVIVNTPLL
jgi:hypothetical protein